MWEQFPCFVTTSHSDEYLERFVRAIRESIAELQGVGMLRAFSAGSRHSVGSAPVAGAKLGRRPDGSLAWFAADPNDPGHFREVADAKLE